MMLAGIGLWSCNADDLDAPADTETGQASSDLAQMTFKASMGKSLAKSTMSTSTGETQFCQDDLINVFNSNATSNTKGAKFAVSNISGDGSSATFGGEISSSQGYYAILPYQDNATINGGEISMTIPTEQSWEYQDLMVGYTSNADRSFQFRHVGTMINFMANQAYESITIESADGTTPIAGDIKVTIGADGKPVVKGGTSTSITIKCDKTLTHANVLATLMPLNGVKLKFSFKKADKSSFSQDATDAKTLQSGVMYNYNQVGKYKITCYKDASNSEVLFYRYTSDLGNNRSQFTLPECPLTAQQGKTYGYGTDINSTTITFKPNTLNSQIVKNDIVVYPIATDAVKLTIYCNGNDQQPVVKEIYPNVNFQLPQVTAQTEEGFGYGYAESIDGNIKYEPGTNIKIKQDLILFLAKQKYDAFNIYFDGPDHDPKTFQVLPKSMASFTLPTLVDKDGYFAGYSISAYSNDFTYYPGTELYLSDVQYYDYYAVYRKYVPISSNEDYNFDGATFGDPEYKNNKTYMTTLPQVPEGTCMVFKFTNHCQEASSIDTRFNTGLRICGDKNTSSLAGKDIEIFNGKYGQKSGTLPSESIFMANINNTEVTARIFNHGGVADVEYSWTGSIDKQQYNVKYSNICTWDNLYVAFYAYKSYIEFNK